MSDYLLPEAALSVTEKLELFAARTEMNENPYNFGNKTLCEMGCKEAETNKHIFQSYKCCAFSHPFSFNFIMVFSDILIF